MVADRRHPAHRQHPAEILLINVYSSCNAGDVALTAEALSQLREQFPDSSLTLAIDDPGGRTDQGRAVLSLYGWVKVGSRWHMRNLAWLLPASLIPILTWRFWGRALFVLTPHGLRPVLQAYIRSHFVVSKPGGFLYSSGRGVALFLSAYTMALALLAGKPLYMYPQSVGPLSRRWERRLVGWLLERASIVMVREPISLSLLRDLGLPEGHGYLWPDMAFAFPAAPALAAQEWLQLQGIRLASDEPLLGMTVLDWGAQNVRFVRQAEYESACAEAARFFVERCGGRVIIFPQVWGPSTPQDDRVAARRVAGLLADLGPLVLNVQEPLSPDLLKAVYGLMDLFVGTRMHSNIFALSQEVPVIAIGYQHKTRGIAQMVGLQQWVVDIDQVDDKTLVKMLADLWEERETVHAHLRQVIPSLVQQAGQAGSVIAADVAKQEEVGRE